MQWFSDSPMTQGQHGEGAPRGEAWPTSQSCPCSYTRDKPTERRQGLVILPGQLQIMTFKTYWPGVRLVTSHRFSIYEFKDMHMRQSATSSRVFKREGGVSFGRWNTPYQCLFQVLTLFVKSCNTSLYSQKSLISVLDFSVKRQE